MFVELDEAFSAAEANDGVRVVDGRADRAAVITALLIEADGLCARYGSVPVLLDIDLHVNEGEMVALLGANGAGKTTTLMTLAYLGMAIPECVLPVRTLERVHAREFGAAGPVQQSDGR
jgi:ABC-type molybdenum transport system ATPase subunit/photorepair protein PhrA